MVQLVSYRSNAIYKIQFKNLQIKCNLHIQNRMSKENTHMRILFTLVYLNDLFWDPYFLFYSSMTFMQ